MISMGKVCHGDAKGANILDTKGEEGGARSTPGNQSQLALLAPWISMAATVEVLRVDLFRTATMGQIRQLTRPRPVAGVVPLVYDFQYCGKAAAAQISK